MKDPKGTYTVDETVVLAPTPDAEPPAPTGPSPTTPTASAPVPGAVTLRGVGPRAGVVEEIVQPGPFSRVVAALWFNGNGALKADEIELMALVLEDPDVLRQGTVEDQLKRFPRLGYILTKWADKGLWGSGVSLRAGWVTPRGRTTMPVMLADNFARRIEFESRMYAELRRVEIGMLEVATSRKCLPKVVVHDLLHGKPPVWNRRLVEAVLEEWTLSGWWTLADLDGYVLPGAGTNMLRRLFDLTAKELQVHTYIVEPLDHSEEALQLLNISVTTLGGKIDVVDGKHILSGDVTPAYFVQWALLREKMLRGAIPVNA
jgi:hypothetical protein